MPSETAATVSIACLASRAMEAAFHCIRWPLKARRVYAMRHRYFTGIKCSAPRAASVAARCRSSGCLLL